MDLTDIMSTPGLEPFIVAGLVMILVVVLEILTLISGTLLSSLDHDFDHDFSGKFGASLLGWLNPGRVPLLIFLIVQLALFSSAGFVLQTAMAKLWSPLPNLAAIAIAATISIPLARLATKGIAALIPRDETYAVSLEALVGRYAEVTLGPLDQGQAGRVRLRDSHNNWHFLMAKAAPGQPELPIGAQVVLVDRDGATFLAAGIPSTFISIN